MQAILIALQFLTRLPLPAPREYSAQLAGRSPLAYPLVGLIIGLLLGLFYFLLGHPASPNLVISALLLLAWTLITGGLHLDGLGDSADAWLGGGNDRQRSLDILKDPRAGSAAVIAIGLLLMLKFAALTQLPPQHVMLGLVLAPVIGRTLALALLSTTPCARPDGLAASMARHLPRRPALLVILSVLILVILVAGFQGVWVLTFTVIIGLLLRWLMLKRLGGTTGDTIGAAVEISETLCLLVLGFYLP